MITDPIVSGSWDLNGNYTDNVRLVYDAKNKFLFRLLRSRNQPPLENYHIWSIWFNVKPQDFADGVPYAKEATIRHARSRSDNKKISPVQYESHKEFGTFP